jgi:4-amino-4-deoxy-L-arabinose transferase-like glycosyltransferase
MIKFYQNYRIILCIIIIFGFALRYLYFINLDSWFDEWNMLYTVDPNINNNETWKRYYGDRGGGNFLPEYYPPINAFLLKYFLKFTNYFTENARLYSLIFGVLTLPISYLLSKQITEKKNAIICTLIISMNIFLIHQSSEIRPHSLVVFASLISIILFIKILDTKLVNIFTITSYIIVSIFLLSSWPFTLTIFFAKVTYILINLKKIGKLLKKIFLIFSIILISYLILNFEYLTYMTSKKEHYTKLFYGFFYSYYFRSFFGSIGLGAVFLISFSFFTFSYFIKIKKKNLLKYDFLILLIILSSYSLCIIYSVLRADVISPKYFIFILPLIIIWIISNHNNVKDKIFKYFLFFIILGNFFNLIVNFNNTPIERPELNKALKIIYSSKVLDILTNEDHVVTNAIKTNYKIYLYNINFVNISEIKNNNIFWFLCINNPRFAVGNEIKPIEKKCTIFDNNKNFNEISKVEVKDLILKKYIKIDNNF